jgi:glycosyltransferase involved in cell wall biosynthesis
MPRAIRVLRVIARLNVGGPAQHVAHLAELDRGSFRTMLVHGPVGHGEADMADLLPSDTGALVTEIPELGRRISWRQDLTAYFSLLRLCREFRPDIVHTHTAKAGTLGRLAALNWRRADGARCKIVHTFHGNVMSGYFGPAASTAVRAIERRLARSTDRIVVVSPQQEREIVSLLNIPSDKVRLIRLGLALDELADLHPSTRDQWGFSPAWPVIGIVGRIVPIKNHELFLRAARRFVDEGGAAGFVVVGGGERESEMRQLAADLNLGEHVRFAGWRRDLRRVYAGLDIVTLTSRNEGTPVALIEAMAAARPVVATAVGGVADVVEHEQTGLLVRSDDAAAISASWRRLLSDNEAASSLGLRARESVLTRYGRGRLLDEMRQLYAELMDTP